MPTCLGTGLWRRASRTRPGNLGPYAPGHLEKDKNVDARKPRHFYLPERIPGLDIPPVCLLEKCIVQEGVPSRGLLFSTPKGAAGWYPRPYKGVMAGHCRVQAFRRANPDAGDCRFGGASARKSLGQWLWTYSWASRMIFGVGGWYTPKVAMDLYFTTHRTTIWQALQQLGSANS
ncbi:hypothetical protein CYMTET_22862 [Cymbomonas tetramitiformis]|uniref:Uncharacterized protein n=1 Tax=Cymbomonas tetramitiformis TaxID=36881 RepID=A0AAE0FZD2_9CHLO|nr:hypothetical protein CYMTET_22862 [Cymbomonas tetramitiformis]